MAEWKYEIVIQGKASMGTGGTCTATIRRTYPSNNVNVSLYSISGSSGTWSCDKTLNVYLSKYHPTLTFNGYGWVELRLGSASGDSTSTGSGTFYDVSSSILNVGTSSKTFTVVENDDSTGVGTHVVLNNTKFTVIVNVTSKYNTSTISCSSPIDFGSSSSVSFSNSKISELQHKVTWQINSTYTNTVTTATGASSASYQIPTEWLSACPSKTKIDCTITVETMYQTNSIGTASSVISLNVPNDVKPSIESLTAAINNDRSADSFATKNNVYLQNLSGVALTANNAIAGEGSSIDTYVFSTTSEEEGVQTGNTYTIDTFLRSGAMKFTVTVTDLRGRQASANCTINVVPYNPPTIISYDAFRCLENKVGSEKGTYAMVRCTASVSSVTINNEAKNEMHIACYYYDEAVGDSVLTQALGDMTSGVSQRIGGALSTSVTYKARFVVSDKMGGSVHADVLIASAAYAIHVQKGGTGVAFGKTSEKPTSVEINPGWNFYYKGFLMAPVVYSATEAPEHPIEGLIWLKKK